MSIGDLIGVVIATYKLFNTTEVLPALFWLGDIEDYLRDDDE